jgi:hypothetical protein
MEKYNNSWHKLLPRKECGKCKIGVAKLEAKEKHSNVTYQYECDYKHCKHIEIVE